MIHNDSGVTCVVFIIDESCFRWFGHVRRRFIEILVRKVD